MTQRRQEVGSLGFRASPDVPSFSASARASETSRLRTAQPQSETRPSKEPRRDGAALFMELMERVREAQVTNPAARDGEQDRLEALTARCDSLEQALQDLLAARRREDQGADAELQALQLRLSVAEARAKSVEVAQASLRSEFASVAKSCGAQTAERVAVAEHRLQRLAESTAESTQALRAEGVALRVDVAGLREDVRAAEDPTRRCPRRATALEPQDDVPALAEILLLPPLVPGEQDEVCMTRVQICDDGRVGSGQFVVERRGVPLVAFT